VLSVALTTVVWVVVTFVTPPTDTATLRRFYQTVRPSGRGWRKVVGDEDVGHRDSLALALVGWVSGCTFVYAALFGTGALLFKQLGQGVLCLTIAAVSGTVLAIVVPRAFAESREVR